MSEPFNQVEETIDELADHIRQTSWYSMPLKKTRRINWSVVIIIFYCYDFVPPSCCYIPTKEVITRKHYAVLYTNDWKMESMANSNHFHLFFQLDVLLNSEDQLFSRTHDKCCHIFQDKFIIVVYLCYVRSDPPPLFFPKYFAFYEMK